VGTQPHAFAWCLEEYGGFTRADAEGEASRAYPYQPASDPYRALKFHDEAWHWAMLTIHGPSYWKTSPALAKPNAEYRFESARLETELAKSVE
jgi:hypothetical protein